MNAFLVFAELQRQRIARAPVVFQAMPESTERIRYTKPHTERMGTKQRRWARDKARRAQLRHEAQLALARANR